jgi:nucleoside-diphosphate-sugar epimerase
MMEPGWFRYPLEGPTIIGGDEDVTVDELVKTVIDASGREIQIEHVEGPRWRPRPQLR